MTNVKQTGAAVSVRNLRKSYGNVVAVDDVSLEIGRGEFVALLGPSGSGKSTILMSVAGFEAPTSGDILLDGQRINDRPPHLRGIGVVFQKYALFPHLTVAENIAYPLRRRGVAREEIQSETQRALDMVSMSAFGPRFPAQLSGGEQQRVALARALVFNPPVLLMDEPLGALDRKLRQRMQIEIKMLHRKIGTTIIFVTHDQEEALSMADRIAVLNRGQLQQIGAPDELYDRPTNAFVADFVGETNLLDVELLESSTARTNVKLSGSSTVVAVAGEVASHQSKHRLGIRPEKVEVVNQGEGIETTVVETSYAGSTISLLLALGSQQVMARVPAGKTARTWSVGDKAHVRLDAGACRLYPVGV